FVTINDRHYTGRVILPTGPIQYRPSQNDHTLDFEPPEHDVAIIALDQVVTHVEPSKIFHGGPLEDMPTLIVGFGSTGVTDDASSNFAAGGRRHWALSTIDGTVGQWTFSWIFNGN